MSRREDIDTAIWSDPDFLALGPDAKLVYFWSFSNPRCGMSGLYKAVHAAPLMETGLTTRRLDAALVELDAARFAFFDGRMLWVRSRIKHLRSKSPNMAKAIARDVEAVSDHPYASELVAMYAKGAWLATVLEPFRNLSRNPSNPSNPSEGVQGKGRDGELSEGSQQHPPNPPTGGSNELTDEHVIELPPRGKRQREQQKRSDAIEAIASQAFDDETEQALARHIIGGQGAATIGELRAAVARRNLGRAVA